MKTVKRLSLLLLVLWGWACQTTSTTDLQPRSTANARLQNGKAAIHKLHPRNKKGEKITVGTGASTQRIGNDGLIEDMAGFDPQIAEINNQIDQIDVSGDWVAIGESNRLVDEFNLQSFAFGGPIDFQPYRRRVSELGQEIEDIIREIVNQLRCQPTRRAGVEQQLNPATSVSDPTSGIVKQIYKASPASTATVGIKLEWSGSTTTNFLRFGDREVLRDVLIDKKNPNQQSIFRNFEAHHLIPWQVAVTEENEVVKKAGFDGFHPNDYNSGIMITSVKDGGQHGNHPSYNTYVRFQLSEYNSRNPNATRQEANKWIQCRLIPVLLRKVINIPDRITISNWFADVSREPLKYIDAP